MRCGRQRGAHLAAGAARHHLCASEPVNQLHEARHVLYRNQQRAEGAAAQSERLACRRVYEHAVGVESRVHELAAAAHHAVDELGGRLLTAKEVGALLQLNASWVLDAARRNAIPHIRLGRYVRFHRTDIETWLLDQRRGPELDSEKRR